MYACVYPCANLLINYYDCNRLTFRSDNESPGSDLARRMPGEIKKREFMLNIETIIIYSKIN